MKKYIKNYIGKGTENSNLEIIKVTLKMEQAESFIYEKDGNRYLTFEISKLKEADKYNRTHTCYVTKLQEEITPEANSANIPEVPVKTKKPRTKKN
jgi:ribosomal protein S6